MEIFQNRPPVKFKDITVKIYILIKIFLINTLEFHHVDYIQTQ